MLNALVYSLKENLRSLFGQKARVRQWMEALQVDNKCRIWDSLFKEYNGYHISQQGRRHHDAIDYTYGEIEFVPFLALLSLTHPTEETVFYDLGSGLGKAIVACALAFPVKECIGIELIGELHNSAEQIRQKLASIEGYAPIAQKIHYIAGDFLHVDLNKATLIFINSTTILNPTWEQLVAKLNLLPNLNTVISTSKPLFSEHFELSKSTKIQMSWGVVAVFIQHRKN